MDKKVIGGLKSVASTYGWWTLFVLGVFMYNYIAKRDIKPDDEVFLLKCLFGASLVWGTLHSFIGGYEKTDK